MFSSPFIRLLPQKPFVAVGGPSGGGKTSLVNAIVGATDSGFRRPICYTTREPRIAETDAEYTFISRLEFERLLKDGKLLNRDEIGENLYGIDRDSVFQLHASGFVPIKEMRLANAAGLSSAGLFVFEVLVDADPSRLVEIFGKDKVHAKRLERDKDLPREQPNGFGLTVRPCHGSPDVLARRVWTWFAASEALWAMRPEYVLAAADARDRNLSGYDTVSSEFTDVQRVTTRYFHEISEPFWRKLFTKRLGAGKRYLEIGPGRGWLRSLGWPSGVQYRGLELSKLMRNLNADRGQVDVGPADAMPYSAASFEGVVGSLIDPFLLPNVLIEVRRVLIGDGWFAGTIPAGEWAKNLRPTNSATTEFVLTTGVRTTVASFCYTADELGTLLSAAGFDQIEIVKHQAGASDEIPPAVRSVVSSSGSNVPIVLSWQARSQAAKNMGASSIQ